MRWRAVLICYYWYLSLLKTFGWVRGLQQPLSMAAIASSSSTPLKVCLVVEPSPLTYISGYKNRFHALLETLHGHDDHVELVTVETTHPDPPRWWKDRYPVHYARGIRLPWYPTITLSTDWTGKVLKTVWRMKPDILHVTSPSLFIFPAIVASRLFGIPLIASYHTHLPVYLRSYIRPRFLCRLLERLGKFVMCTN
jgi:sulfoquinovosyltransferase